MGYLGSVKGVRIRTPQMIVEDFCMHETNINYRKKTSDGSLMDMSLNIRTKIWNWRDTAISD